MNRKGKGYINFIDLLSAGYKNLENLRVVLDSASVEVECLHGKQEIAEKKLQAPRGLKEAKRRLEQENHNLRNALHSSRSGRHVLIDAVVRERDLFLLKLRKAEGRIIELESELFKMQKKG